MVYKHILRKPYVIARHVVWPRLIVFGERGVPGAVVAKPAVEALKYEREQLERTKGMVGQHVVDFP